MTEVRLIHGSGADMAELAEGEAALVLTSPPYFPEELEPRLRRGGLTQKECPALEQRIQEFAFGLRPVFAECDRVLPARGTLIVQTRDVRLADRLVGVEGIHRLIVESYGWALYTRHLWRPRHRTVERRRQLEIAAASGAARPFDPEVFLVFRRPGQAWTPSRDLPDRAALESDILIGEKGHLPKPHPFQSPIPVLSELIRAWTDKDDLVVDPFAGGGTTLIVARGLGRRAVGYERDPQALALAQHNLERETAASER